MSEPNVRIVGSGMPCLFLAPVGAAWYEATLPPETFDLLQIAFVEPSADSDFAGVTDELEFGRLVLGADRPIVVGHSANGLLALAHAAGRPEAVAGVVLIGTPPNGVMDRDAIWAFWAAHAEPERQTLLTEMVTAAEALPDGSPERKEIYRRANAIRRWFDLTFDPKHLDELSQLNPEWVQRVLLEQAGEQDWPAIRQSVRCRVLALHGDLDFVAPHTSWEGITDLEHLNFRLIEHACHQPFVDQPASFLSLLTSWLESAR